MLSASAAPGANAAPAWLTYVSAAVAVLALVISGATYFRAGPRVKVRVHPPRQWWSGEDRDVTIVVVNSGLAPVDVEELVVCVQFYASFVTVLRFSTADNSGDVLRLLPGSRKRWKLKIAAPFLAALNGATNSKDSRGFPVGQSLRLLPTLSADMPRIRLSVPWLYLRGLILTPFTLIKTFGVMAAVDLGNGTTRSTFPNIRLSIWLFRYALKHAQK